jgi:formiminoglutamate deiminase
MTSYWLERAVVDGDVHDAVRVDIRDGRFTAVRVGAAPDGADRLAGLTVPGLANCHSHAFHRALRGRTQQGRGSFWTWREQMYALAGRLTPDAYYDLARAVYREMLATGFTSVGEFHYLHHGPDGTPYDDPNAMGLALVEAARDAGIRIALLDTCYLAAGIGSPPEGVQRRFADGDAEAWAARVDALRVPGDVVLGAAIHSVRAVPRDQMHLVARWADARRAPLHAHVSEQLAENIACQDAYGETPTGVLEEAGALGPRSTAVHATHLTDDDVAMLGDTGTYACFCPTTERDLADGIGPARALHDAGSPLSLGSDQHVIIDPFEELRGLEMHERLITNERDRFSANDLLLAASFNGYRSLGWSDGGHLRKGALADFVTVRTDTVNTAGAAHDQIIYACVASDVSTVVVGGDVVVSDGHHRMGDVGRMLVGAIDRVAGGVPV